MEMKINEKNYYLSNSELIFNYFEKKQEISKGNNKTTVLNNFLKVMINRTKSDKMIIFQSI